MSYKEPSEDPEYAAAVAAAAFAITSLEPDVPDHRKPDFEPQFSLPRVISGIVDRIASAAAPGEATEKLSDDHQAEAKEMVPERTIHPVPSTRRTPSMPKKRLTFADDELQKDSGKPFNNYQDSKPTFDDEEFEESKKIKPTNSFTRRTPSMRRTPSYGEQNAKTPKQDSSAPRHFPAAPIPPPPAVPPLHIEPRPPPKPAKRPPHRKPDTNSDADDWERHEMAKIKERYEKLNTTILEWEDRKKQKARRKLETTEVRFQSQQHSSCYKIKKAILTKVCLQEPQNDLDKRRTKALQKYQNEMQRVKQIADGARAQAKEKRRNEEFKVKDKANKYRTTGEPPMPPICSCL